MWGKRKKTWNKRMRELRQLQDRKQLRDQKRNANNNVGDENNNYNSDIDKEIPLRLVLSEEINIYDNLYQGSDAYNSSAQYVRSSGIVRAFEQPYIPTIIPENLPCVSIMHPSRQPYMAITIKGIKTPCLLIIGFYDVGTR